MCAAISSSWETLVSQKYERNKCIPFRLRMYRLNGFVRPIRSRFLSTSQNFESTKLNHGGIPQNKIPYWEDENVNIGYVLRNHIEPIINSLFSFMTGRSDVRAQRFKKQTKKNAATRRTRVQIVDNSKWGTAQMHEEPEFVISYRKRKIILPENNPRI